VVVTTAAGLFGWQHFQGGGGSRSAPTTLPAPAEPAPSITGVSRVEGGALRIPGRSTFRPHSVTIIVAGTTAAGIDLAQVVHTDAHGRFRIDVPPGRYTVTALNYGPSTPISRQPHRIATVTPGRPVSVRITAYVQ
jgi:hypothetical protein